VEKVFAMSTDTTELDAFYQFAQRTLRTACADATLEDVLREFREQESWTPRTPLGKRLKELRQQFVAEGGELLTADEVTAELRQRRGKHFAEE
jgi:hypothetical protein